MGCGSDGSQQGGLGVDGWPGLKSAEEARMWERVPDIRLVDHAVGYRVILSASMVWESSSEVGRGGFVFGERYTAGHAVARQHSGPGDW